MAAESEIPVYANRVDPAVEAVVAAHRVAAERYPTLVAARRAHSPLVALMVGYTVLSLWIVSRPVVAG